MGAPISVNLLHAFVIGPALAYIAYVELFKPNRKIRDWVWYAMGVTALVVIVYHLYLAFKKSSSK